MRYLELDRLRAAPLRTDPYEFIMLPNFVASNVVKNLIDTFPKVSGPGSHPLSAVKLDSNFQAYIDELEGDEFREIIEEKFDLDLSDKPTMMTIRGKTRARDGAMHTDTITKIITVLIYMNHPWDKDGGRLRLLNNGTDLNNFALEIPPENGTILIFRRSEKSWHGHKSFAGKRQAIQLNWMTSMEAKEAELRKHRLSSRLKRWNPANLLATQMNN